MWLGQLFRELKVLFSNTTREDLCAGLRTIGVDARLAERGRPEEKTSAYSGSLGVIDVSEGPIRWVNVVLWGESQESAANWYKTDYGVPDPRCLPKLEIRSIRMRGFPKFGRVINVRWKGDDRGLGLRHRLSSDEAIRSAIMNTRDEVRVVANRDHGCWLIRRETKAAPSGEQWGCYNAIAEHLLEVHVTGQPAAASNPPSR